MISQRGSTFYGCVLEGSITLTHFSGTFTLHKGMYFSLPDNAHIAPNSPVSRGILMQRLGYEGIFSVSGPLEEEGRLRYIDGCTDSLLIPPVILGDPCLNLLHIPAHTEQTQHTHPSLRYGVILSGSGICKSAGQDQILEENTLFHIPADSLHSFNTKNNALRVLAWHPDSDMGPTHENHPMVNKTILAL